MTEDQLTLEAYEALRGLGFPQDNWPQMVARVAGPFIRREDGSLDDSRRRTVYEYWQGPERALAGNLMEYVAAPDPLTALRYCTGLGYSIAVAVHVHGDHYSVDVGLRDQFTQFSANSASDCILAIAAHRRQQASRQ